MAQIRHTFTLAGGVVAELTAAQYQDWVRFADTHPASVKFLEAQDEVTRLLTRQGGTSENLGETIKCAQQRLCVAESAMRATVLEWIEKLDLNQRAAAAAAQCRKELTRARRAPPPGGVDE